MDNENQKNFSEKLEMRIKFLILAWGAAKNVLFGAASRSVKFKAFLFLFISTPFVYLGKLFLYIRQDKK